MNNEPEYGETGSGSNRATENRILEQLAFESLREQRRGRRWSVFFKVFMVIYLLVLLGIFQDGRPLPPSGDYTALVDLSGVIMSDSAANANDIASALRDAFEASGTKGVILRANSPGGSPVQAGYIYDEIKRLREKYPKIPVYTVVQDYCASACYYIAAATNKIYANKASAVGSIGVLINAFGFVELMNKLGVERRLLTAGKNKGFLDMFSPLNDRFRKHAQTILDDVHQQFIKAVKQGRGDRLKETDNMFSGLYWTGSQAKEMGLVDDLASPGAVARDIIKAERIVDFSVRENVFERFAKKFGAGIADRVLTQITTQMTPNMQ